MHAPPELDGVLDELAALAARAPVPDLTLDQAFCTPATKLRRALVLLRHGLVPADGVLLVGDDDLFSVTLALIGRRLGIALTTRLAVVDVSRPILDFLGTELGALGVAAELVEHDLREPLPAALRGAFESAMTDPPYTPEGAALFLARAVEGLAPGPGHTVAFSFAAKGPQDALDVQDAVVALGLVTTAAYPEFNAYDGAGVISGRSTLSLLGTTQRTTVVGAPWTGTLYTADRRGADREYLCLDCRTRQAVGPTGSWPTVAALKDAGCPSCGGTRFRPLSLLPGKHDMSHHPSRRRARPRRAGSRSRSASPRCRSATVRVTDPETHRKRLAKGLEARPRLRLGRGGRESDEPVGWLWMAINTNFLTQERYGNLRSLAVSDGSRGAEAADALLDAALAFARSTSSPS